MKIKERRLVTVGKVNETDADVILELQKQGFLSEAKLYNDYSIPPLHQTKEGFLEELQRGILLKAEVDGHVVGSVRAYEVNQTCYIGKLIVDSSFQNQGIGQQLMSAIEEAFPTAKRFELFTGFKSEKNLYLYRKLGYSEIRKEQIRENIVLVFMEKVRKD